MSYLLSKNTVNGAEGKVFVTVNGRNAEVAAMKAITTNAEIQSEDMRVIGTRTIQTKNNGAKLTGTGTIYYGTSLFTEMVLQYINSGVMPEWSLQISNTDAASGVGNQRMIYYGCQLIGTIPLSILDSEQAMLSYEFEFSYRGVDVLERFTAPESYGN